MTTKTRSLKERQFNQILAGLDAISDQLADLAVSVQEQSKLLRQLVPNEKRGEVPASQITAAAALGRETCADQPLRSYPATTPLRDPNLGSL